MQSCFGSLFKSSRKAAKIITGHSGYEMDAKMDDVDEMERGKLKEGKIHLNVAEPIEKPRDAEGSVNADKNLIGACSQMQTTLERLQEVILGKTVPTKDAPLPLSFSAIQIVNSVFCSMDQNPRERNREILSRSLAWVMSQIPRLFIPEQMRKIETMICSIDNSAALPSTKVSNKEKEVQVIGGLDQSPFDKLAKNTEHDVAFSNIFVLDKNGSNMLSGVFKLVVSELKSSPLFMPLPNLKKDPDVDSLPSPSTSMVACKAQDLMVNSYETDALVSVPACEQQFSPNSFVFTTRIPRLTPPEGGNDGDCDTIEEVSSRTSSIDILKTHAPLMASSVARSFSVSAEGMSATEQVGRVSSGTDSANRASARSRGHRLQIANPSLSVLVPNQEPSSVANDASKVDPGGGIVSSRKLKTAEEAVSDGPVMKRPRNVSTNKYQSMEEADPVKLKNGFTSSCAGTGVHTVAANSEQLPALLKNIVLNPSVLSSLLKMGDQWRLSAKSQQKSSEPAKNAAHPPSTSSIPAAVSLLNVSSLKPSDLGQRLLVNPENPSQVAPVNPLVEMGEACKESCDP